MAGLLPPLTIALLLNVAPGVGAALLFGRASFFYLVPPATIALAGISLHAMVYAVYRGRSEIRFANVLQIFNLALAPLIGFAVGENSAASVLTATGVTWLLISGVGLLHVLYRERADWKGLASMQEHLKVLLRFLGLPRVPGEFALVGLFAIPSLLAVRAHRIVEAGHFSAALSVLTMAAGAFAPVGLVVLPRASAMAATGDVEGVRRLVRRILVGGILVAALGVVVGELVIPFFIRWYFGDAFTPAVPYFRAVLLATIPYAVYILMRSILDALDVRPLNSRNLIVTLSIVTILCLVNRSIIWMAASIVGSLVLLSVLTLRDVRSRLAAA